MESQLADITNERDSFGSQMIRLLDGAAFDGQPIDQTPAQQLESSGNALIARAQALASQS